MEKIKILQGNCIDKIKELKDNSIDCVVSSPPYFGLRDYGVDGQFGLEKTYQDYLANTVKVFETFKPKLKDTATIWWNVGDSYSNHKDCKSIGQTLAKGTTREKAHEIKKGKSHTRDSKLLKASGLKDKDLMMIPNRVAIALQAAGWYIRSEIIWHKPNPMPESVRDRPTQCHEKIWLITKSKKYYYDADAVREPCQDETIRRMTLGNKGKVGNNKNSTGWKQLNHYWGSEQSVKDANKGRNRRNVWTITTKPFKDAHFATFPKDLIEPCIKAGSPEGGVVLDPFGGSGTTGIVAQSLNRQAILIELNKDYINIAKKRINKELGMFR
jgi:DNA modification methylase